MKKLPAKPTAKSPKKSARDKEIREVLQDADFKKFDPELIDIAPPKAPKRKRSR
ncbi:MAG: hypothetical protein ACREH9_13370 [Pseudomonadota bacterium]